MYIKKKTSIKIVVGILSTFFIVVIIFQYYTKTFSKVSVDLTTGSIQMQDFHRVATKNGKKSWEVSGKQVAYSPQNNLASVENAELIFFSDKRGQIRLSSKKAKVSLKDGDVNIIELNDNVLLEVGKDLKAVADIAFFSHSANKITVPNEIKIFSEMGNIEGIGLEANLNTQTITILSNVKSVLNQKKGKS